MKIPNPYKCDECGVQKQESNHWVLAFSLSGIGVHVVFQPWDDKDADEDGVLTLCGEGCAAKVLSKEISKWKAVQEAGR